MCVQRLRFIRLPGGHGDVPPLQLHSHLCRAEEDSGVTLEPVNQFHQVLLIVHPVRTDKTRLMTTQAHLYRYTQIDVTPRPRLTGSSLSVVIQQVVHKAPPACCHRLSVPEPSRSLKTTTSQTTDCDPDSINRVGDHLCDSCQRSCHWLLLDWLESLCIAAKQQTNVTSPGSSPGLSPGPLPAHTCSSRSRRAALQSLRWYRQSLGWCAWRPLVPQSAEKSQV